MRARVCISLSGSSFDPNEFHAKARDIAGGEVRRRRHSGAPLTDVPLDYWVSSETEVAPEDSLSALSGLLSRVVPLVKTMTASKGRTVEQVLAHVVLEFDEGDEPVGLQVPQHVIHQLNEIGASLDIDAVPRLRSPN